jgi:hypothetical protein
MPDEHTLLERRITWIEREVVRLILVAIGAFSIFVGGLAYEFSVDRVGGATLKDGMFYSQLWWGVSGGGGMVKSER